ncbi:hypothetical protein [Cellulomonas aerilata]|uniref:Uncharacterized protein n=1 Tax=Cellulomonas aerilata TaxID=515326 RepID=A0A512DCH6_9CELL|nr:hypothetical protein [Cellulomonas aerilata]GEO34156.1 hypothetical protein CAE01nite_18810 [Cellulomonas aerilata]
MVRAESYPAWLGHMVFVVLYVLLVIIGVVNVAFAVVDRASGGEITRDVCLLVLFIGLLLLVLKVRRANRVRSRL